MSKLLVRGLIVAILCVASGSVFGSVAEESRRHWQLACSYVKKGMANKAVAEAKIVLKLDPNHSGAKELLAKGGKSLAEGGALKDSGPISATMAGLANAAILSGEAKVAYHGNRPNDARKMATDALLLEPGNADAAQVIANLDEEEYRPTPLGSNDILKERFEKGIGLYRQEAWSDAVQVFQDAIAISPTHEQSGYFYNKSLGKANKAKALGLLAMAKEDIRSLKIADAKAKLNEARSLDPDNGEIGRLLGEIGGDTAAEERRKKANELYEKGKAQYEREEYQSAVATLENAVNLNPNHKEAVDLLAKARESDRISSTERVDRIAKMHEEALKAYGGGDYGKAKGLYQGILKLDPNDERAQKNLQLIESKMGKR